jgi:hypothetical protein
MTVRHRLVRLDAIDASALAARAYSLRLVALTRYARSRFNHNGRRRRYDYRRGLLDLNYRRSRSSVPVIENTHRLAAERNTNNRQSNTDRESKTSTHSKNPLKT